MNNNIFVFFKFFITYIIGKRFNITSKICCIGFSASGILSGNCVTHFDYGNIESEDPIKRESSRYDLIVIDYGAFCFTGLPQGFFFNPFENQIRNLFFK